VARRLQNIGDGSALLIASGATSLPSPIATWGMVPAGWDLGPGIGVVPTLDVHFRAAAAVQLTSVKLYSGRRFANAALVEQDFADTAVNASTNAINVPAHALLTGDGPFQIAGTVIPGGLAALTDYYVVKVDADHFKLAASLAAALAGTTIDITSAGTGPFALTPTSSARRFAWSLLGNLGTLDLDAQISATVSIDHRPTTVAYACTATFGAAVGVTIQADPVVEQT
jgi:hypothetical protein